MLKYTNMIKNSSPNGQYLLFAGDYYYPLGGWEDFIARFDKVEFAQEHITKRKYDWAHIVDIDNSKIIRL